MSVRRMFFSCILILASTSGLCQSQPSARDVVRKYCELEGNGGNFDSRNPNAKAIGELLIDEDPGGYDTSVIVRSFQVGQPTQSKNGLNVEVTYTDIGIVEGGAPRKEARSESVIFHVRKVHGLWKIDGLRMFPHVSQEWLLQEYKREEVIGQKMSVPDPDLDKKIATIKKW